jgi:hypothetical protein
VTTAPDNPLPTLKEAALNALHAGDGAEEFFAGLKERHPVAFAQFLRAALTAEIKTESRFRGRMVLQWKKN